MTVAASAQSSSTPQATPDHLSKQQLNTLIAAAKTPAEHARIASYYQAQASDFLAQAKEHQEMIAAYRANSTLSTNKNQTSTIGHCEHYVKQLQAQAANSQILAAQHDQMARGVVGHVVPSGN
jgi:hypothetical protein